MAEFLYTNVVNDEAISASEEVKPALPVNPISHLELTYKLTRAATINAPNILNALSTIDLIEVLFKGSSVWSIEANDLLALVYHQLGYEPPWENEAIVTGGLHRLTLVLPFGRSLYDPTECFPASRRGELFLRVQHTTLQTDFSAYTLRVDACELPGASPRRFLKATTLSRTPTAAGDLEVDLPLGNKILGCLLFSTTVPAGSTATRTITNVKVKVDNVERYYNVQEWEALHAKFGRRGGIPRNFPGHVHTEVTLPADTLGSGATAVNSLVNLYGMLDFDPNGDGMYALETEGRGRVHLVINAGDINALRVVPIELIELPA